MRKMQSIERYRRQIPIIREEGQKKIKETKILIAGVGGLGSITSILLAETGIGELILIDHGTVKMSNLNRQLLYTPNDIGKEKSRIAEKRLKEINPETKITAINQTIKEDNIAEHIKKADIVIDGMDNYEARYILNKVCVQENKPFIHGAVHGTVGQIMTIVPHKGPCLQCLIPKKPPTIKEIPILTTTPTVIGSLQTTEAIKLITKMGDPLIGRLLVYDGLEMKFHEIRVAKKIECKICGKPT